MAETDATEREGTIQVGVVVRVDAVGGEDTLQVEVLVRIDISVSAGREDTLQVGVVVTDDTALVIVEDPNMEWLGMDIESNAAEGEDTLVVRETLRKNDRISGAICVFGRFLD